MTTPENQTSVAIGASEFSALLGAKTIDASYSPLCLQFNGWPDSQRRWTLRFQQRPTNAITLEGDEPTRDEIVQCLLHAQAPIWMIGACEVAAAVANRT